MTLHTAARKFVAGTAAWAILIIVSGGFRVLSAQDQPARAAGEEQVADERAPSRISDYKRSSAREQKILDELEKDAVLEFIEVPLSDVVEHLKDVHEIPIELDGRGFEEAGVSTDRPITMNLKGISLRNALDRLLEPHDLDFVVRNSVLQITSKEAASRILEARVYDIRQMRGLPAEKLVGTIRSTIRPGQWAGVNPGRELKGEGKQPPRGGITLVGDALIVTHTWRVHEQVANLLQQLAAFQENPLYGGK